MSVRLRLMRIGKTHRPFYRVCVFDQRKARGGKYIESIGHYDPMLADDSKKVTIDKDRAAYWLSVGASASETVESFLRNIDVPGLARKARRSRTSANKGKPTAKALARAKHKGARTKARKEARARGVERAKAAAAAAAAAASSED